MANKPFEIQGSTLTIGGVDLQAGTTSIVIPGVTRATTYRAVEVEDIDSDDENVWQDIPVVIDQETYNRLAGIITLNDGWAAPTYEVKELDDDGKIDDIEVTDGGTIPNEEVVTHMEDNMFAAPAGSSIDPNTFDINAWVAIPYYVKCRAGEVETIGSSAGGGLVQRDIEFPVGEEGDTKGTLAQTDIGAVYVCIQDWEEPQTFEVDTAELFATGQTAGEVVFVIPQSAYSDVSNLVDINNPGNWTVTANLTLAGEGTWPVERIEINPITQGDFIDQNAWWFFVGPLGLDYPSQTEEIPAGTTVELSFGPAIWDRVSTGSDGLLGDLTVVDGNEITNTSGNIILSTGPSRDIQIDAGDDIRITANDQVRIRTYTNTVNIITDYDNNDYTWQFDSDGNLRLPEGGDIVDSNGVSVLGGAVQPGPLYIMANTDGNISTSVDGDTWSNAIDMGINIGTVAIGPDKIVYTRADHNADADGFGLYSTNSPLVPPTLIAGTEGNPGGDLTWQQVQYFAGTTYPWVAVGYQSQTYRVPVIAYSTNATTWEITYYTDDGTYATQNLEFTDIAHSDGLYLISASAGTDSGGLWWTADFTTDITIANHVALPANFSTVEYWDIGGESQFYGRWHAMTDNADWWVGIIDPTDQNNWADQGIDSAIATAILDATGMSGQSMEESASGEVTGGPWMWLTSSGNGHIVHQANGPVGLEVSIPNPYITSIADIVRNPSNEGSISQFTHVPANTTQNTNWTPTNTITPTVTNTNGTVTFEIVVDGDSVLTSVNATDLTGYFAIDETVTVLGSLLGGTDGVDDIVITVVAVIPNRPTTITYTAGGEEGFSVDGEKITIASVTSADASEPGTTEQSYNGEYYIKRIGGDPTYTYELYTDQALTDPWLTHTYWPVNQDTGTITWSHGMYLDSLGFANGHFYVGNDNEEIFKSTWNPDGNTLSWTKVDDKNDSLQYWNDFAYYGAFGANSTSGTGDITFNGIKIFGAIEDNDLNAGGIKLIPNSAYEETGQYVKIYPTNGQDAPHIHIAAGYGGDLIIGDDIHGVDVNHDGSVYVETDGTYIWQFGLDGKLTVPDDGIIQGFGNDGTLRSQLRLDSNSDITRLSGFSSQSNQYFDTNNWATGEYTDDGGTGVIEFTGASDIVAWLDANGMADRFFYSVNDGPQMASDGWGGGSDTITFYTLTPPETNPTTVTSFRIYYQFESMLDIDTDDDEFLIRATDIDLRIETRQTGTINIESDNSLTLEGNGSVSLRNIANDGNITIQTADGNYTWNFDETGKTTLPGAVVKSTVAITGAILDANDMAFEVTAVDGSGVVTEITITNTPNTAWQDNGAGTGALIGDISFTVQVDGSGNATVSGITSSGGHSIGETFTLGGESFGAGITPTALDLTKTVNKLTDGIYSLADGVEGQIMYLVRQTGSNAANIGIEVANARVDGSLYLNRSHYPFSGGADSLTTLIYTDGAWQSTNGGWSIVD